MKIIITLSAKQEQQLHKARGKRPVLSYLKRYFGINGLSVDVIEEVAQQPQNTPNWLSDLNQLDNELSNI